MADKRDDNRAISPLNMLKGHAEYCMAMNCYYGIGARQDHIEASSHFQSAALLGHPEAQASLGWLYLHGDGVPRYKREAFRWFRAAADQGSAEGMCRLALMYASGEHVEQNWEEAEKLFRAAAEKNHAESMYYLSLLCILGPSGQESLDEGVEWMKKAAKAGFADAAYTLGCIYKDGKYIASSMEDAVYWLEKAVHGKQMDAALLLGSIYEKPGERNDPGRSRQMYLAAARLGSDEATSKLASVYMQSSGDDFYNVVSLMPALVVAADRGHAEAAYVMGCFFQQMDSDYQAESYFALAEQMGSQKASLKRKWLNMGLKKKSPVADIAKIVDRIPASLAKNAVRVVDIDEKKLADLEDFGPRAEESKSAPNDPAPSAVSAEDSSDPKREPKQGSIGRLYSIRPLKERGKAPIIKWLSAVRNHRDSELLLRLAIAYHESPARTAEDVNNAFSYFLRAAELGNAEAAYKLALMYKQGEGTSADSHKAKYWLERAASQHFEPASEELRSFMPQDKNE